MSGARNEARRGASQRVVVRRVAEPQERRQGAGQRPVRNIFRITQMNTDGRRNSLPDAQPAVPAQPRAIVQPGEVMRRSRRFSRSMPLVPVSPTPPVVVPKANQFQIVAGGVKTLLSSGDRLSLDEVRRQIIQIQKISLSPSLLMAEKQECARLVSELNSLAQSIISDDAHRHTISIRGFNEFIDSCHESVIRAVRVQVKHANEVRQATMKQLQSERDRRGRPISFWKKLRLEQQEHDLQIAKFESKISELEAQVVGLGKREREESEECNVCQEKIDAYSREFRYQCSVASDRNHVNHESACVFTSAGGQAAADNAACERKLWEHQELRDRFRKQILELGGEIAELKKQLDGIERSNESRNMIRQQFLASKAAKTCESPRVRRVKASRYNDEAAELG